MNDLLAAALYFLLVALLLSACVSDDAQQSFRPGDGSLIEDEVLAVVDAAANTGDGTARVQQVMFRYWLPGDYAEALPQLEALAHDGEPQAAHLLATAYMHGRGVEIDYDEAARWLDRAVAPGSESADRDLAHYRDYAQ